MQVLVWRGLYFVHFRFVKLVDLCGFITATPSSTVTFMLLLTLAFCTLCQSFLTSVVLCFKGCKFSRERSNSNSVVWLIQPCAFGYRFFKFMRSGYELTAWTSVICDHFYQ